MDFIMCIGPSGGVFLKISEITAVVKNGKGARVYCGAHCHEVNTSVSDFLKELNEYYKPTQGD